MQSLLVFLFALLTLVAPACAEDPTVEHFARLDRAGQEKLVREWLTTRFDAAASIALDDSARQPLATKYDKILHRIAAGESLSDRGYRQLVSEIGAIEQAAIDQLSLRYRVMVYSRFRTNRAAYDQRMVAWRNLLAEWKAGESRFSNGKLVIDWLNRSLQRLQYDEVANLPELPNFGSPPRLPVAPLERLEVPLHPANPRIVARQEIGVPAIAPPLGIPTKSSPAPQSGRPALDPPRIAHRVEKPALPEIAVPPRANPRDARPVIAPPEAPPRVDAAPMEPAVMIDLEELSVRIRGYNLALKELTASLHGDADWTPEQLQQAFAQFEDLTARHAQILLYRNLVSSEDRQLVGNPLSLDSPIALLGGKIFAARTELSRDGDSAVAKAQLDQLDTLSRKLAQLAAERAQ